MSNHLTISLLTKGILNDSKITNGFISYEFISNNIKVKHGSGGYAALVHDYSIQKPKQKEDIDCIKVTVNWNDRPKDYIDKKIYVEFIKNTISVELLINENVKIDINLID